MSQRILILGGNGFIGRQLSFALQQAGHDVLVLTRSADDRLLERGIAVRRAAYLDAEDFHAPLADADLVIHAASTSTPGKTAGAPLAEMDGNLRPTLALLSALQQRPDCRLLYVSSGGTLYGDCASPAGEEHALAPRSYYAAGKIAAEHFIQAYARQFGGHACILRPSNLYGPGQPARPGFGVIPAAFQAILRGAPFELLGDAQAMRDYLYIDDFVELCRRIVEHPASTPLQTLNAASGEGTSLAALIEQIGAVSGSTLSVAQSQARSGDVQHIVLDPGLAASVYHWRAGTSLREGLERTWQWWKTQA